MKNFEKIAGASALALGGVPVRGALWAQPRAEGSDPAVLFAEINRAVAEMRAAHEDQLKAKADDVVVNEKIDRINAAAGALQ